VHYGKRVFIIGNIGVNRGPEAVIENGNNSLSSTCATGNAFSVMVKYRKFISYCVFFSAFVTTTIALLLPNLYKSTVSVFPVEKSYLVDALGSASSPINSFSSSRRISFARALKKMLGSLETDRCLAILKSNTALLTVVQKYDLVRVYGIKSYPFENAIKELLKNVEFKVVWEGNLYITVYDEDPQRAADIANFFVEILNRINSELIAQSVQGNRQFIEEYYKRNLKNLTIAEDSLKSFQKRFGVISLPEQTRAYIETAAELKGQLIVKEIQANILKKTLSFDHPYVRVIEMEIEESQKKLSEINDRTQAFNNETIAFSPFGKVSAHGLDYYEKYSNVEIQYKIRQFITSLYEQAKAEELRNTSAVVLLDRAERAERKSRPQRLLIILGGVLVGGLSAFSFSLLYEKWMFWKNQHTVLCKSLLNLFTGIRTDLNK
jgi:tyrosine-protein kinase Etk/Wzc